MSINILLKKKQQSIDGLSSQISNIFLLLATFATKYVIMLNNSNLPLTPLKIFGSSCPYSGALQFFQLVFLFSDYLGYSYYNLINWAFWWWKMFFVKMHGSQLLFSFSYYIYYSIYHQEEINYLDIHTHFSYVHNCRTVS